MVLAIANRVRETSTTTGTGTYNLDGAVGNHVTFVVGIGTGNTCHYLAVDSDGNGWEIGVGTVTDAAPDTLARTSIIDSSNSGSAVDWAAGTRRVMCIFPGDQAAARAAIDAAGLNVDQEYTGTQNFNGTTLSDATTIEWDAPNNQVAVVTLGGDRILDNANGTVDGATYILRVQQDDTGSRLLTYGTDYKFPGGIAPTLTTAANSVDILTFTSNSTFMFGVMQADFK